MLFSGIVCVITGISYGMLKKRKLVLAKMCLVLCVLSLLGILLQMMENQKKLIDPSTKTIERNEAGEGDVLTSVILDADGLLEEYEYELLIPEKKVDLEQAQELFEQAKQEITDTFLGDNESLDRVDCDVILQRKYQKGIVTAEWSFDCYDYVDIEGHLQQDNIPEEGYLEKASCELSCGEYQCIYEFYFQVFPKKLSEEQTVLKKIKDNLTSQAEKENEGTLYLPTQIDGYTIQWREMENHLAWKFTLLGVILALGIWMSELERKKKEKEARAALMALEYPEIVSKLSLLLGAGMTLNASWNRIAASYLNERQKNTQKLCPAYEEMVVTCREIESGVGERTAYEHFGERCGGRRYRKLSSLLIQNAKKGTKGLAALLEQEAEEAFEERKNSAKKLGEEAGTKLLFPMLLMLGIVIAIIMVPALLSFQIG